MVKELNLFQRAKFEFYREKSYELTRVWMKESRRHWPSGAAEAAATEEEQEQEQEEEHGDDGRQERTDDEATPLRIGELQQRHQQQGYTVSSHVGTLLFMTCCMFLRFI